MNDAAQSQSKPERHTTVEAKPKLIQRILSGLPTILVLSTMGTGWMVMHHINSQGSTSEEVIQAEAHTASDTLKCLKAS